MKNGETLTMVVYGVYRRQAPRRLWGLNLYSWRKMLINGGLVFYGVAAGNFVDPTAGTVYSLAFWKHVLFISLTATAVSELHYIYNWLQQLSGKQ
jgi:hypothetical protein